MINVKKKVDRFLMSIIFVTYSLDIALCLQLWQLQQLFLSVILIQVLEEHFQIYIYSTSFTDASIHSL